MYNVYINAAQNTRLAGCLWDVCRLLLILLAVSFILFLIVGYVVMTVIGIVVLVGPESRYPGLKLSHGGAIAMVITVPLIALLGFLVYCSGAFFCPMVAEAYHEIRAAGETTMTTVVVV